MKVLVKYLKGRLKGRLDIMSMGSAHAAQKNGIVEIIKVLEENIMVLK